jgi:hypothetical protein
MNSCYSAVSRIIKCRRVRNDRSCIKETSNVYKILVSNPERKRLLGRPRHNCVNIKVAHKELVDVNCIQLSQDRNKWYALVNSGRVPWVP